MKWTFAILLLLLPLAAQAQLAGSWTLTINTPRGEQNPKLEVVEENGVHSGTYYSQRGPIEIRNVHSDGSAFSFSLTVTVPIGDIDVDYKGTIDGDKMSGKVINPRGEVPFIGVRDR